MKYNKITIGNIPESFYADVIMHNNDKRELTFVSLIANNRFVNDIENKFKKRENGYIVQRHSVSMSGKYKIIKSKDNKNDFTHMVITKEDKVNFDQEKNNDSYEFYIYYRSQQEIYDRFYDKLYEYTSIPILREWIEYIFNGLARRNRIKNMTVLTYDENCSYKGLTITFDKNTLQTIVTTGLKVQELSIEGCNTTSNTMMEMENIESYLTHFGDILCNKIKDSFVPKFNPFEDEYKQFTNYYSDSCYNSNLNLYEAQLAVIQAVSNNLNKSNFTIINGEMGSGNFLCM